MITIEQCRAARGLLNWTQQDLAGRAALSKTAINNFEKGYSDIKSKSLRAIKNALESAEIEFIDETGIRKRADSARILKDKSAFHDLISDIEKSLSSSTEIMISPMDRQFAEHYGPGRLDELLRQCAGAEIPVRILCSEEAPAPGGEVRFLPADSVQSGVLTFLYARKVAFILWGRAVVIIVESHEAYHAERQHFEQLWNLAEPPVLQKQLKQGQ